MYKHIFFDLDHTLWDFKTNATEALWELSDKHKLTQKGINSVEKFIQDYIIINDILWEDYRKGFIQKEELRFERFRQALKKHNIEDPSLCKQLSGDYVAVCPLKTNLFPNTIETLDYLKEKYVLHIITNGFEEVQHIKINNCNLTSYFSEVITSERAGYKKPDSRIFEYAINCAQTSAQECLMIGDSLESDIIGARNVNINQVYFNPEQIPHNEEVTHEISDLSELMKLI